jgi:outer membrane protein assembly factor BamB
MQSMNRNANTILLSLVALLVYVSSVSAIDWTQFRGEGGASFAAKADLPATISASENVLWAVDLPGKGPSSPIVVGNKVFVSASGGPDHQWMYILCFDADSGKQIWKRQFWTTGRPNSHPSSGNAAPTPVSDGEHLYVFFSSIDLICLDLKGNLVWYRGLAKDYPKAVNDTGLASSPVLYNDLVIVQVENQGDPFTAAINKYTGKTAWRIEGHAHACWSSPTLVPGSGKHPDMLILHSSGSVRGVEAATGKELWKREGDVHTSASTVYRDGVAYVLLDGVTAMEFDATGQPKVLWHSDRMRTGGASPVVTDKFVYIRARTGVVSQYDKATGEQLWQIRVGKDNVWSTPLVAGDYMYCFDYNGGANVLKLGSEPEVVSSESIDEIFQGSPALGTSNETGDAIFIRSDHKLYKIGKQDK